MDDARWHAELYLRLIGARVRAQLEYRTSFFLDLIATFLINFVDFLAVVVLFAHLPRLGGWSLPEVAFFYGTANMAFAFSDLIVGHLDLLSPMIRTGSFDLLLIRPVGSLFQVLSADMALRRLARVLQGAVVLVYAISNLHTAWTPLRLAMLILMVCTGTAIYSCIWIIGVTIAFYTVETQEIVNAFTYGGSFLASYPVNIFSGWTRRLLAFVVPMAFVSYFPGLYVLHRPDPLHAPDILQFCGLPLVIVLVILARGTWQVGVRHYRSTGS